MDESWPGGNEQEGGGRGGGAAGGEGEVVPLFLSLVWDLSNSLNLSQVPCHLAAAEKRTGVFSQVGYLLE